MQVHIKLVLHLPRDFWICTAILTKIYIYWDCWLWQSTGAKLGWEMTSRLWHTCELMGWHWTPAGPNVTLQELVQNLNSTCGVHSKSTSTRTADRACPVHYDDHTDTDWVGRVVHLLPNEYPFFLIWCTCPYTHRAFQVFSQWKAFNKLTNETFTLSVRYTHTYTHTHAKNVSHGFV